MSLEPEHRIEEAHGIWELQVARLAGMVEVITAGLVRPGGIISLSSAASSALYAASADERGAFEMWQEVSNQITDRAVAS